MSYPYRIMNVSPLDLNAILVGFVLALAWRIFDWMLHR
jgi:hypothetical protein